MRLQIYSLLITTQGMPSHMSWMMAQSSHFHLATRIFSECLRSLQIIAKLMAHPLKIGLLSLRETLMTSGSAMHAGMSFSEKSDAFFTPTTAPTPPPPPSKQKDLLAEFKKGIKRDASLFNVLKDPKQWDTWHCSTMAQARAQDVSDVLDTLASSWRRGAV